MRHQSINQPDASKYPAVAFNCSRPTIHLFLFATTKLLRQISAAADRPARRAASRQPCCYTNVDAECDKQVTDNRHQFITMNIHPS